MQLKLSRLPQRLAVCRLDAEAPVPPWIRGTFTSVTRTTDELSIVCDEDAIPQHDVRCENGWMGMKVEGPIPFETTGVAAALVAPLAAAEISVFLVATFDTDYLLVKASAVDSALRVLRAAGHDIV